MAFNWDSGVSASSSFDWNKGTPVSAPTPALPKPKVNVQEVPYIDAPAGSKKSMGAELEGKIIGKIGNAWDKYADKPLVTLPRMQDNQSDSSVVRAAKGAVSGIQETAEGLTTPKSIATIGAIGAASAIPYVGKAIGAGAGAYFTYEMAKGAVDAIPAAKEAYDKGDWYNLARLTSAGVAQTLMAASGVKHMGEAPLRSRMGMEKPAVVAPPPLVQKSKPLGWQDLGEVRGIAPNEQPVPLPKEVPYMDVARDPVAAMGTRPLGPRESVGGDYPLRPTPGKQMPGRPIGDLKAQLQKKLADRNAAAQQEAELTREAQLADQPAPQAPPIDQPWPVAKSAAESANVFREESLPKSARESAEVLRQQFQQKPVVPETGIPENVARAQDARENLARQMTGKPWAEVENPDRLAIDDLIQQGYTGSGFSWEVGKPVGKNNARRAGQRGSFVIGGEQENLTPEQQAAKQNLSKLFGEREQARKEETPLAAKLKDIAYGAKKRFITPYEALYRAAAEGDKAVPIDQANGPRMTRKQNVQFSINRALGARTEADMFMGDAGLAPLVQSAKNIDTIRDFDQYMTARGALDEMKRSANLEVREVPGSTPSSPKRFAIFTENGTRWGDYYGTREKALAKIEPMRRKTGMEIKPEELNADPTGAVRADINGQQWTKTETGEWANSNGAMMPADLVAQRIPRADVDLMNTVKTASGFQFADGKTFEQAFGEVSGKGGYGDKLLDKAVNFGTLTPEYVQSLRQEYPDGHVPLNRVFSELEEHYGAQASGTQAGKQIASLTQQKTFLKRKGSERKIESPLNSMILRTYQLFSEGTRNQVAKEVSTLAEIPEMQHLIREVPPKEYKQRMPKHSISYLDGGKRRIFETDPELETAAKQLDQLVVGAWVRMLRKPNLIFKRGTTGWNPAFLATNPIKDILETSVTAPRSVVSGKAWKESTNAMLKSAMGKSTPALDEVQRMGGGFTETDFLRSDPLTTVEGMYSRGGTSNKIDFVVKHPIKTLAGLGEVARAVDNVTSATERLGRVRVYEAQKQAYLKQGYAPEEAQKLALLDSNNRMPYYQEQGTWTKIAGSFLPYFSANIAGTRSVLGALRDHPKGAAVGLSALGAASAAITLWNLSNPKRAEAYRDGLRYQKNNSFTVMLGNEVNKDGKYPAIELALPPGLVGANVNMVRRLIESQYGNDPIKAGETLEYLLGAVSPLGGSKGEIASNLLPQQIKPTAQAYANFDFFRGTPKVGQRMQELPPEYQSNPGRTSGTAKYIAKLTKPVPVLGEAIGGSPIKAEEWFKDTIGGIAPEVLWLGDKALQAAGVIKANEVGGKSPAEHVAGRFYGLRAGQHDQEFYELRKQVQDAITRRYVGALQSNPQFDTLPPETQKRLQNSAVAKARAAITQIEKRGNLRNAPSEIKLRAMKSLAANLGMQQ